MRYYAAEKVRQGEIILKRPWQKVVFLGGLAASVLLVLAVVLIG
jgi:hypothetical protein